MRDHFAIGMGDALRLVDGNAQEAVLPATLELDLDNLDPGGLGDPPGNGLDFRENGTAHSTNLGAQQKSGLSPTS
jgi:hypothetical protein